jgi:hypothetical protein
MIHEIGGFARVLYKATLPSKNELTTLVSVLISENYEIYRMRKSLGLYLI